ncbi:MAG: hypothetical protein P4L31_04810 [Candidatus Babeliales bacterium]|nr:hypothetical protein [Candidatus Babeliales bacterium]
MKKEYEIFVAKSTKLTDWGWEYTYHWFWGLTPIRLNNLLVPSINESINSYDNKELMATMRHEVEVYRQLNFISRFFIWLFNYNDLVKKNILVTYIDTKNYINKLSEDIMNLDESSPNAIAESYSRFIGSGVSIGKQISHLGSVALAAWSSVASYLNKRLNGNLDIQDENEPRVTLKYQVVDAPIEGVRRVYHEEQISALAIFGLDCSIGDTYSEQNFKEIWRRLARARHPDKKGGSEALFKELNKAYILLAKYAEEEHLYFDEEITFAEKTRRFYKKSKELSVDFSRNCLALMDEAESSLRSIVETFEMELSDDPNKVNLQFITEQNDILDAKRSDVIEQYSMKRIKLFKEYSKNRKMLNEKNDSSYLGSAEDDIEISNLNYSISLINDYLHLEITKLTLEAEKAYYLTTFNRFDEEIAELHKNIDEINFPVESEESKAHSEDNIATSATDFYPPNLSITQVSLFSVSRASQSSDAKLDSPSLIQSPPQLQGADGLQGR